MSLDYANDTVELTDGAKKTVEFVAVANHFTEPVDLTIDFTVDTTDALTADSSGDPVIQKRANVGVGETVHGTVTLKCDSSSRSSSATIDFHVTADGDGVSAETTAKRTVEYEVDCNEATESGTTQATDAEDRNTAGE
jgi:hypothetical protein